MDARQVITAVLSRVPPTLDDATALQDIATWDSLKLVRLVLQLEDAIGRELSEAEVERLQTVGDVAHVLHGG